MYNQQEPFNFNPTPKPDHINRSFIRKDYDNGDKYEGEVDEHGKRNGRGVLLKLAAGIFYEGYFINGKANGRGRSILKDGDLVDGEFRDGQRHGFGLWLMPNSD